MLKRVVHPGESFGLAWHGEHDANTVLEGVFAAWAAPKGEC